MVTLRNVYYSIAGRKILSGVSWTIPPGKRLALVGANGSGKTTLLKLIAQELTPQEGEIIVPRNFRLGYLPQEILNFPHSSVLEHVLQGRPEILKLEQEIQEIHNQLTTPGEKTNQLLSQLGSLEEKFQALAGYQVESKAKIYLSGLGFSPHDFHRPLSTFSGGWTMRAYLARLLLQAPDLLLLDEPTNHLDLVALEWLEQYLLEFKGAVVIVSHDRYFIDRLADEIYELENGLLTKYPGRYSLYLEEKRKKIELQRKKYEEQLAERERILRFVQKYRSDKKRARQVQSRLKLLEKMEPLTPSPSLPRLNFRLSITSPSYKDVLIMEKVWFRFDPGDWLFRDLELHLTRGAKTALVGPNGSGKTTLTRLITGELKPQKGRIRLGPRTQIGYYSQQPTSTLNPESSVYEEVIASTPLDRLLYVREVLGIFQFKGEEINKKIGVLSGGEKARVSLAKILLSSANFLIMDEPTTHLDLIAREALEEALRSYEGTLLIISHDRYFLDRIVHQVIEINNKQLIPYPGNYTYYSTKKKSIHQQFVLAEQKQKESSTLKSSSFSSEPSSSSTFTTAKTPSPPGRKTKEQRRREAEARQAISQKRRSLQLKIKEIEERIMSLENRKKALEEILANPQTYQEKGEVIAQVSQEYSQLRRHLDQLYSAWEKAGQELEKLLANLPSISKK